MKRTVLAENLAREMARAGYNEYSLALAAGLKADAIRDVMRGKTQQPNAARLDAIARVLNRTTGQLLGTEPLPDGTDAPGPDRPGQLIHDPAELTLIVLWRSLNREERHTMLADIIRGRKG